MAVVRLIGLWGGGREDEGWPDVRDFVDLQADLRGREEIAARLEAGVRAGYAYMGHSSCRICGQPNGAGELTDGTFLWPEGLAHYVRDHRVCLPAEVEDHLRGGLPVEIPRGLGGSEVSRDTGWWLSVTTRGGA